MSTALDHSQKQEAEKQTPPWHQAYPPPRNSNTPLVSRQELLLSFRDGKVAGKDFVLVDLRRNDHEVSDHTTLPSARQCFGASWS